MGGLSRVQLQKRVALWSACIQSLVGKGGSGLPGRCVALCMMWAVLGQPVGLPAACSISGAVNNAHRWSGQPMFGAANCCTMLRCTGSVFPLQAGASSKAPPRALPQRRP